jgi:hypothetical protein
MRCPPHPRDYGVDPYEVYDASQGTRVIAPSVGMLKGQRLEQVPATYAFWFAW